jgi:hypothetical protein
LFVAEKRAAIEAVTKRLEEVDLHHLVFDLHGQNFSKRQVAEQVAESLQRASTELPPAIGLRDLPGAAGSSRTRPHVVCQPSRGTVT